MRRAIETLRSGWWRLRRVLPGALRRVVGFPDYPAYLEHCRRAGHAPRLTERAFVDAHFAADERVRRCC